jgi:putative PEP-CTERM system TPR-repeat lipoprotein
LKHSEARIAFGRKDLAKARELTQEVLKRAPGFVPALALLGAIEFQEKHFDQAAAQLQSVVARAPNHAGARVLLVRSYLASGKPSRAVDALGPMADPAKQADPGMLMLIGEAHFANGDLKQASTAFEKAAQTKGQQPLAQTWLAQIAMAGGDVEGGVRKLESLATEEGAPAQIDMALLTGYLRQGNTGKALEVASGMVKKSPNDPSAHQALGSVLVLRKELPAARAAFAQALELNSTYMPAVASLAQLDLQEGKTAEARTRFEAVLAKEPNNVAALMGLSAVLERAKAPSAKIVAVLQRAIAAQPDTPGPRLALINRYLRDRETGAALTAAQEASAALGQDPRILDALGRAQLAAGDSNQAIETFNRLAAAEPSSPVPLLRLAGVYTSRKEPERAIDVLLRAQKLAPADPNITRELAALYLSTGKSDLALKQAKALQVSSPKSAAGFALEGDVHRQAKQLAAAEKAYRDGLKIEPASSLTAAKLHNVLLAAGKKAEADALARSWVADHPKDLALRNYLGEQALRTGDHKAAAAQYQAIVDQQPDSAIALNNLAWTLGKLGDPKALGYAERAFKVAPESASVLDTLGVLLVAKGDTAKGIEYIAEAVQLAPNRQEIRLNYAKALLNAGRKDDARKELMHLQGVTQDFSGKAEVAELLK